MWCANCKADVAAQVKPETDRVTCASCGTELAQAQRHRPSATDARAILERWSRPNVLDDPFGPVPSALRKTGLSQGSDQPRSKPDMSLVNQSSNPQDQDAIVARDVTGDSVEAKAAGTDVRNFTDARQSSGTGISTFRMDGAQGIGEIATTSRDRQRTESCVRGVSVRDEPHDMKAPHFALQRPEKQTNWNVIAGQWLAYIGVLGLTVGTAVVVYGYFGGYTGYTPTGWLITTVGQMLLFLGVINLVSGGMEQSSDEVAQRIEILGEHILRIEQAAAGHALQGPSIAAARFGDSDADARQAKARDTVAGQSPGLR